MPPYAHACIRDSLRPSLVRGLRPGSPPSKGAAAAKSPPASATQPPGPPPNQLHPRCDVCRTANRRPLVWAADTGGTQLVFSRAIHQALRGAESGDRAPRRRDDSGFRTVILEEHGVDYRSRSPLDGSEGWIGEGAVCTGTRFQDIQTRETCTPPTRPRRVGTLEGEPGL
jgi:hypothetical protein